MLLSALVAGSNQADQSTFHKTKNKIYIYIYQGENLIIQQIPYWSYRVYKIA